MSLMSVPLQWWTWIRLIVSELHPREVVRSEVRENTIELLSLIQGYCNKCQIVPMFVAQPSGDVEDVIV